MGPAARNLKIVGIHLAGPSTRKSSVVRASMRVECLYKTRLNYTDALLPFYEYLSKVLNVPVSEKIRAPEQVYPPLIWEAFSPELGAQLPRDSDARLLDAITDLGPADIYCIDAPMTLPPCFSCTADCRNCTEPAESKMLKREFENTISKGRAHTKPALPYLDRFFEYHARSVFNHPRISGNFEFEPVLGSGRAPLTARSVFLRKRLMQMCPNALILESNPYANLIGWAVNVGYVFPRDVDYRFGLEGQKLRLGLFKKFELLKYAIRSAGLHADLLHDMCQKIETFAGALSALSVWGLLNGHIYLLPEFFSISDGLPCLGWACVPLDISAHAWD